MAKIDLFDCKHYNVRGFRFTKRDALRSLYKIFMVGLFLLVTVIALTERERSHSPFEN